MAGIRVSLGGEALKPTLSDAEGALLRSQGGPLASAPFVCFPMSRCVRKEPQVLRVLFLRRLCLLSQHALADVAVLSTPLAITGRRVLLLGRWDAGGSLWRTRLGESVER